MVNKIRNRRVTKLTVGDLKKALKNISDDTEVVLGFYMKDEGVHYGYLSDIMANMKFDSVLQEKLFDVSVVELACCHHDYCTYVEKDDDK